jgi:hypothetical protein
LGSTITNIVTTNVRDVNSNTLQIINLPNTGAHCNVRVRVSLDNGSTWETYGAICEIHSPITPGMAPNITQRSANNSNTVVNKVHINLYPKPASGMVSLQTDLEDYGYVLYDQSGKLLYSESNG